MNDILLLKGKFQQRPGAAGGSPPRLGQDISVKSSHLVSLVENLNDIRRYWRQQNLIRGILIDVQ